MKWLWGGVVCVGVVAGVLFWQRSVEPRAMTFKIGEGIFHVRLAKSETERARGLSGVARLEHNEGMLFVFPTNGFHGIWMKDIRFPIDILWLAGDGRIIDARENISPSSFPEIFSPAEPARFVVELPSGAISTWKVKVGEQGVMSPE